MTRAGITALMLATWGGSVAAPAASAAEEPDPLALYKDGRFEAAAAEYERRWQERGLPEHGVNAVMSWRAAGHYAHARALLDEVRREAPPASEAALRVELLAQLLTKLTGTLVLEGADERAVVKVDAAPAETIGGDILLDVGTRELSVERRGCETFRRSLTVRPSERLRVTVELVCHELPGSLHVTIEGAKSALVVVDGKEHSVPAWDLDVPLEPGAHELAIRRNGLVIRREAFTVASGRTTKRRQSVPWRARGGMSISLTATGLGLASSLGTTTAACASFGYLFAGGGVARARPASQPVALPDHTKTRMGGSFTLDFGAARSDVEGIQGDTLFWVSMSVIGRLFAPRWYARTGSVFWALDIDPLAFRFGGTGKGDLLEGTRYTSMYWHFFPITLSADTPWIHLELVAWPLGYNSSDHWTADEGQFGLSDILGWNGTVAYSGAITLTAGWAIPLAQ